MMSPEIPQSAPIEASSKNEEQKEARHREVMAKFRSAFPEYSLTDFSSDENLLIFKQPDQRNWTKYIQVYPSWTGFNARMGETDIKEENGQPRVNTKNKKKREVRVPIIQESTNSIQQIWDFDRADDAVYVAKELEQGAKIDDEALNQIVSISEDTQEFKTLRDLFRDQFRLGTINNKQLLEVTGRLALPYSAPIQVRRLQNVSEPELKAVTLQRLTDPQQRGEVEQGTPEGQKIMRRQIVEVETILALVQMDRFRLRGEGK